MKTTYSKIRRATVFVAITASAWFASYAGEVACKTGCCSQLIGPPGEARGYLNSPRGREEFPWVARTSNAEKSRPEKLVAEVGRSALARSPRFLEEHPELSRAARTSTVANVPPEISSNRALASSPRVREEFPALRVKSGAIQEKLVCVCASALN